MNIKSYLVNRFTFTLFICYCPFVSAVLSVQTIESIEGYLPEIPESTKTKLLNNIYFIITSSTGDKYKSSPDSNNNLYVSYSTTIQNVALSLDNTGLTAADLVDLDGDTLSKEGFILKDVIYEWKDSSGNTLSNDSSDWLGGNICTGSYNGDHTLNVSATIEAKTQYGLPNSAQTNISKTFTIIANDGLCYIQPGVLALNIPNG